MVNTSTPVDRPCARPGCPKRVPATGPKYHSNSCKSAASRARRREAKAAQASSGQHAGTTVNRSTSPSTTDLRWWTELSEKLGPIAQELQALSTAQSAAVAEHRILRQLLEHTIPHAVAGDRSQLAALVAGFDAIKNQQSLLHAEREALTKDWHLLHAEQSALRKEQHSLDVERDELKSQREEQSKRWDSLQTECSALRTELSILVAERDELRAQQSELRQSAPQCTETSLACVAEPSIPSSQADWEALVCEQRDTYASLFEDMQLQFLRLLPLIPRGAGAIDLWSSTSIESRAYWKHWLVPLLGPQLEQRVKNTGITSPPKVMARVNRMLPYAVLAAQIYLSEIIIRPARVPPSDTKLSQWVLASMRAAPKLYLPQFLSVAEQDPTMLSLATADAMTPIHRQLLAFKPSAPVG